MAARRVKYGSIISDNARWDGFEFRPGDIVISTPPKCGTTWMQMICALLIFQTPEFEGSLDLISPWLDMLTRDRDSVFADLAAQTHRRFIKSHTPLDGLPDDPRVTYIAVGRDPRDVALSWDNHMVNMDMDAVMEARAAAVGLDDLADFFADGPPVRPESEVERFWLWIDQERDPAAAGSRPGGLAGLLLHLGTFWAVRDRANVVLVHYGDLQADLEGEMRRIADRLDITVPEDRWPALVEAATFERMRANADRCAPDTTNRIFFSNAQFFNRGTSGQWKRLLDDDGLRRYRARVASLAPPDLAAWVHHES